MKTLTNAGIVILPTPSGLRFVRARLGLTQLDLARELGVSFATINRWERNKYTPTKANREALENLCRRRNVDYESYQVGMMVLQVVNNSDAYTAQHCHRVCVLAERIARDIDGIDVESLKVAAILHDVGKIFVSPDLVKSDKCYNNDEKMRMQEHVPAGRILVELLMYKHPRAALIVSQHHARLKGDSSDEAITIEARLLSVCDVFDAMTTTRPYKPAKPIEDILDMMKQDAGLDQDMVARFCRCIRRKGFLDCVEDDDHLFVYRSRDKFYRMRVA